MKYFLIVILFSLAILTVNSAFGQCFTYPCMDSSFTLEDLMKESEKQTKYMDPEWMEKKKLDILDAFERGVLDDWLKLPMNELHSVHLHYFLKGELPMPDGSYLDEWWQKRLDQAKLSPKQQQKNGFASKEIVCKENFWLVFKAKNGSPACIYHESIEKFYERGWLSKSPHDLDYKILAKEAARQFIISSPTFKYDGIEDTLKIGVYAVRESLPPIVSLSATFSLNHEGYGDRTGEILNDSITNHTMTILISKGTKIQVALIDDMWDELNQTWKTE